MTALVGRLDPHGRSDSLGQKLIALTAPGVPDIYQGTELWEDSLVDPDNRRPVDYEARRKALAAGEHAKLRVVREALTVRRERPASFLAGGYRALLADGQAAEHMVSFVRADDVLVAASRWTVRLADKGWGDTSLSLPEGSWTDRLTGSVHTGVVAAADLFAELPVVLMVRADG